MHQIDEKKMFKKITNIVLSASFLMTAQIFADDANVEVGTDEIPPSTIAASQPQNMVGFMTYKEVTPRDSSSRAIFDQITERKIDGSLGIVQPPKSPTYGSGAYATADFLYWESHIQGMEYAISTKTPGGFLSGPAVFVSTLQAKGAKVVDINQTFDPGFRVGFGYRFEYDFWDLNATWTRLHRSNSTSVTAPAGGSISPLIWLYTNGGGNAQIASNHNRLEYDTVDLQLSRSYFVSRKLALTPSLGVRGAFIEEKFQNSYSGQEFVAPLGKLTQHGLSYQWAVGPRAGLNANFCFDSHWSLFGSAHGTLAFGRYLLRANGNYAGVNPNGAHPTYHVTDKFYRIKTNVDIALGLQWGMFFNCQKGRVDLTVAYEFIDWIHQNQYRNFPGAGFYNGGMLQHSGDLTFQGLTVSARVDF